MTPAGIEPATFRFVAQHLNHCAIAVPECVGIKAFFLLAKQSLKLKLEQYLDTQNFPIYSPLQPVYHKHEWKFSHTLYPCELASLLSTHFFTEPALPLGQRP